MKNWVKLPNHPCCLRRWNYYQVTDHQIRKLHLYLSRSLITETLPEPHQCNLLLPAICSISMHRNHNDYNSKITVNTAWRITLISQVEQQTPVKQPSYCLPGDRSIHIVPSQACFPYKHLVNHFRYFKTINYN